MLNELHDLLETKRFDEFFATLPELVHDLTEQERQELLVEIIDFYYDRKQFSRFKNVFDLIIGSKLNLNFNIEHWAPTFLSLVVLRAPYKELFDYFVKKGANINFIGDSYAFEDAESLEYELKHSLFERYQTCLDFAQLKLDDMLLIDYNYDVPDKKVDGDRSSLAEDAGDMTISIREYLYLYEQSEYLFNLIFTDRLVDHIKNSGGKTFEELKDKRVGYK